MYFQIERKTRNMPFRSLLFVTLLTPFIRLSQAEDDRCSWTDSGSVSDSTANVRLVQLSCSDGHLLWNYPDGALIAKLLPTIPSRSATSWQFCVRLFKNDSTVTFYHQNDTSLIPLESVGKRDEFCFDSTDGISLYLQKFSSQQSVVRKSWAGFFYSVRPIGPDNPAQGDLPVLDIQTTSVPDRCQPCGPKQLARAFCSAELVFKGRPIESLEPTEPYQQLKFLVQKLIRKPSNHKNILTKYRKRSPKMIGSVYMWSECPFEISNDENEDYLIMAHMHVGRAKVLCAPLSSDFASIVANIQSSAPCQLS